MKKTFQFKGILQKEGWLSNAKVTINDKGAIVGITQEFSKSVDYQINGFLLPGFQNAHSHAFQYAMAGLTENRTSQSTDDFWSWREAMYQLALCLNPDQIESIAAMLYAEMVRHGYTHVAEFHYLHHDKNNKAYQNLSETGERLIAAAATSGINITLIPVFYQKGGFNQAPNHRQKRFISETSDDYFRLVEASKRSCKNYKGANLGFGIHSIRAVEKKAIIETVSNYSNDLPFHIHIAEQLLEVEQSIQFLGMRPVEFLLNHIEIDNHCHLVHATHLTSEETIALAKSKGNVVLCPSTEGNLGDGIFPFNLYKKHGGTWSIGTDSHIGLSPFEELRILDYGQRLITNQRNTFIDETHHDSGQYALESNLFAGRKAMNNFSDQFFKVGDYLNAVIIDARSPLIACTDENYLTSTILYTADVSMLIGTFVNGNMISFFENDHYQKIKEKFISTIKDLKNRA